MQSQRNIKIGLVEFHELTAGICLVRTVRYYWLILGPDLMLNISGWPHLMIKRAGILASPGLYRLL